MQTLSTATCATLHRAISADCTLQSVTLRFSFVKNLARAWFEALCLGRLYYENIPVLFSGFGRRACCEIALLLPRRTPNRRGVAQINVLFYRQIVFRRLRVCSLSPPTTWFKMHALGRVRVHRSFGVVWAGFTWARATHFRFFCLSK